MLAKRIVPLIVAVALFMENMDSTVIATSLPAIAADIGTSPLTLKLAVTSYLLSLAVFIPLSGWTADRFGARTVFRAAIAVFMLGSIGCAVSGSLYQFVLARILEGTGGAMMTPVGRLVLVRSVDRRELINAMVWVTLPALIGPLIGPALGGFITTFISWHWIFLINIPIGLAGIVLATIFIEDVRAQTPDPFDPLGAVLAGLGIGGLAFGGSLLGLNFLPTSVVLALIVVGAGAAYAYVLHARRTPAPVLDLSLLEIPTMRAAVVGGFIYRSGIGAMPFLLPLLLQLGFNLTAFQSGLITLSNVVGAMGMKTVIPFILRRYGFRRVLVVNALISAALVAACATFTPGVSFAWIVGVLIVGGFFRSLEFTSLNTIAYADVDNRRMSRATSLVAVAQQVSISVGVAIGALAVDLTLWARGRDTITAADFQPAYLTVAVIAGCAFFVFARLPADAGAELALRTPTPRGDRRHNRQHHIGRPAEQSLDFVARARIEKVAPDEADTGDRCHLQTIDGDNFPPPLRAADASRRDLAPAAGRGTEIDHPRARLEQMVLVVDLDELEGGAATKTLALGARHVRVVELSLEPKLRRQRAALARFDSNLERALAWGGVHFAAGFGPRLGAIIRSRRPRLAVPHAVVAHHLHQHAFAQPAV